MSSSLDNFVKWYVNPIEELSKNVDNGFIILITSFALLERYLRIKNSLAVRDSLNNAFHEDLKNIFNELTSIERSKKFWNLYRNGLLHNAFMKHNAVICNEISSNAIQYTDGTFKLNPSNFSKKIISTIITDFSNFENDTTYPYPEIIDSGLHTAETRSLDS